MATSSQKHTNQTSRREADRRRIRQPQSNENQMRGNQMRQNQTAQRPTSTAITIRLFGTRDYEAVVAVNNAVFPDRPSTAEEWRYDDEHFDKQYVNERYVAERPDTGEIVGFGGLWHVPWALHPRRFGMEIRVRPDARRRGIGSALWRRVEEALRVRGAISVKMQVWEAMPNGLAFASRLGFRQVMRAWESRLDVGNFDFPTFRPALDHALAAGMQVTTLATERERDRENLRRLHAAEAKIAEDVPQPPDDVHTPVPFDMWMEQVVDAPWSMPDAYFIAVVDGEYAGVSSLFRPQVGDWLNQGLTGVRREFRGRGIATALKVRTVEYARDLDVREIRTWNEINNQRILAINTKFGFVRQPAWITLQKDFEE
jgi:GNAT superfamily N-acetyltransferase